MGLCTESKRDELRDYWKGSANREFDERHGVGSKCFDRRQAKKDEDRLMQISEDVVSHVNAHVAHLEAQPLTKRPATFDQLHEALDEVHALVKKYRLELEAVTLGDPVLAGPWLRIFRVPWIDD